MQQLSQRRCERNSPAGTKVREKGGVAPGAGAELPLQPMEDPMLLQLWYELFPEHINSNQNFQNTCKFA